MRFESALRDNEPGLRLDEFKVHLATGDRTHPVYPDPLDAFRAGELDEWQSWQSKPNFTRSRLITLIQLPSRTTWLFAGCFRVGELTAPNQGRQPYKYTLHPDELCSNLVGRLTVRFDRKGRNSYRLGEKCIDSITVEAIRSQPLKVADFPGFAQTLLSMEMLRTIVQEAVPSWQSALGSVCGVYAIADHASGRLYVGSATGYGGFWSRWAEYAANGHGDNVELKQLLKDRGSDYARHFQFSVLETADTKASVTDILEREQHWKRALLSNTHGYNAN